MRVGWCLPVVSGSVSVSGVYLKVDCNSAAAKSISALVVVALAFVATQFNKML
jgi:hypothetical protein